MTTAEIIERAEREGVTEAQIERAFALYFEQNNFRAANGFPLIDLEDVMPRYETVA